MQAGPGEHGMGAVAEGGSCSLLHGAEGDEAGLELGGTQLTTASGIFKADLC